MAPRSHAAFVIKAAVNDADAEIHGFAGHRTMYGGKRIAVGDPVYLFSSEIAGGAGLVARGVVEAATPVAPPAGGGRWTPRVSVTVRCTARARRALGRAALKPFRDGSAGGAEAELDFKLYRQATDKIVGITATAAAFLDRFF